MAYDEGLAERVRDILPHAPDKAMFGGIAWFHEGHLVVAVLGDDLVARVGPASELEALGSPHVRPFDFTGRPMRSWVVVGAEALAEDEALAAWVARAQRHVAALPPK